MDDEANKRLIEIIDNLLVHPVSRIFAQKIVPSDDFPPSYFEIIKTPMDLETIRQKLINHEYSNLDTFTIDIELVWHNVEKYYGKKSNVYALANEVHRLFKKFYRPFYIRSIHGFCDEAYKYRTKLENQISNSPFSIQSSNSKNLSSDIKNLVKNLIPEEEMQNLITASELLTDKDDHLKLKQIIEENQPNLIRAGKKTEILTTELNPQTFQAVKAFLKEGLIKQGLEYPE